MLDEGSDQQREEIIANLNSSIKKLKIVSIVLSALFFVFVHITTVIPGMYYLKFDRSMTIIRPYIDEKEYNSLKSKWHLMKSKDDYEFINQRIHEVRDENGLK